MGVLLIVSRQQLVIYGLLFRVNDILKISMESSSHLFRDLPLFITTPDFRCISSPSSEEFGWGEVLETKTSSGCSRVERAKGSWSIMD